MDTSNSNGKYEVLSPWAEADPIPLKSISPRLPDLAGKKIGLYSIVYKRASALVNSVVARQIKEKFPTTEFNIFERDRGADLEDGLSGKNPVDSKDLSRFEDWLKGVDAVIGAVGD
jgi:hypothetical protein